MPDETDAAAPGWNLRADLQACKRDNGAACERAANVLEEGLDGNERDEARAMRLYDAACAANRCDACRRLAGLVLAGEPRPPDEARGVRFLEAGCRLGCLVACTQLGDVLLAGEHVQADAYQALQRYQQACTAGYPGACLAIVRARTIAESFDLPLPRAFPSPPTPQTKPPTPEAACPPLFHITTATGGGERLNHGLRPVPLETLRAALVAAVAEWTAGERSAADAGVAGRRTGAAWATYRSGNKVVDVAIADQFVNCTLQPGTGRALLSGPALPGSPAPVPVEVGGVAGVVRDAGAGRTLTLWLGDRCEVTVAAGAPATDEDLAAVAAGLELRTLASACARREAPGWR